MLAVRDVQLSFAAPEGGRVLVLSIEHFAVARGEQVALQGSSGSGKTSLLHAIAGLVLPERGSIEIAGRDLCRLSEAQRDRWRAQHLGYVFQSFLLLQGYDALENVLLGMAFGPGPDEARARELLVRVGLGDRLHHKPAQLSAGQQQRVALARALANRPALVLADEPTGNLDAARGREALALLRDTCREAGAALLLVSHDPAVLGAFARVERMEELNAASAQEAGA